LSQPAYQVDGRACSEDEFYAWACDPARSVIVEACAGAGKTWILVSRIVRALMDGAKPGEILAITFTRKAAGEMRARLHEWLREWTFADAASRIQALVARGVEPDRARAIEPELGRLHARILAGGETLQVSTFHAWFARLLRLAPTELLGALGLHGGMALIEEIDDLRPELMQRFQHAVVQSESLLADYRVLSTRHRRARLAAWLAAVLDKRTEIDAADAAGALEAAVDPASRRWPDLTGLHHPAQRLLDDRRLRATAKVAAAALLTHSGRHAQTAGARLSDALEQPDPLRAWQLAQSALFTKAGSPRVAADLPQLGPAFEAFDELAQQIAQHDAWDDHQRMCRLARALLEQWASLKRERSLVDMPDLERCALAVLSDSAASGWVQERLDVQTRHVLIDEFQDTSPLQWHALQSWLSSYAGAGGGASGQRPPSVFIVGDPKQSIYRFRRAEPRVFEAAREFVVAGLGGRSLGCNHTRRCAPAVVGCLNAVFGAAASSGDYAGFSAHSTAAQTGTPGHAWCLAEPAVSAMPPAPKPPVNVWRASLTVPRLQAKEPRAADEARRVARAAGHLVRTQGFRPADLLVLARRRVTLTLVADELRALDLPCVAAESLRLSDLVEVNDLVAVLDILASPGHDLSLAQALKSPMFGASDADLLALSTRAAVTDGSTRWWSALQQWHDAPPAILRAHTLLAGWAVQARRLPPHDLLDRIVCEGDCLARMAAVVPPERRVLALSAVDALLEQSLSLEGGRYLSVYRFVRALRQRVLKVPAPARDDAIRLLTIHGAKGLEARAVFVVDCDANPAREAEPTVMVDWPVEERQPRRVAFVVNARRPPSSLAALQAQELQAGAREELNALYVAMTRAREILVFSRTVSLREGRAPSWWSRVRPHVDEPRWIDAGIAADPGDGLTAQVPDMPRADRAPERVAGSLEPRDHGVRRLGLAVHRVLQWVSKEHGPLPGLGHAARAAAREFGLDLQAAASVATIVARMRASAELARFFDPHQLLWAGDEVELAHDGTVIRIDRLVRLGPVEQAAWWVLDYKLESDAGDDPAYRSQLMRYRDAVRNVSGGEFVHAAIATADGRLHLLN